MLDVHPGEACGGSFAGSAWECNGNMTQRSLLARLWYGLCWYPCWLFAKLWFRFGWAGGEHMPMRGGALVVCNHQSHLDPVLVGIASPRPLSFLARHTLFFWPLGWLIRSLGAVPIDRSSGRSGIKATLALLKAGEAVLMFPEGTRSSDGRLQPLQTGFCALARRSGVTIVPASIDGAFGAMPRGSIFPRPKTIRLVFGKPIAPEEYAGLSDAELSEWVAKRMEECATAAAEGQRVRTYAKTDSVDR